MKRLATFLTMLFPTVIAATAGVLQGSVKDKKTGEPLTGATVMVADGRRGATADLDGNYLLTLNDGTYSFTVRYVGFKTLRVDSVRVGGKKPTVLDFELEEECNELSGVIVVAVKPRSTEASTVREQKESNLVQTGVSSQQIAKTQDSNAGEVVRRVPGVSIIDDKFVMVRGLSQRYNNVWLNGGAVPSSEADSRAFSFDVIPSGQIDNISIVKSPAPEFPADFTGGFITVNTKQTVTEQAGALQIGTGADDHTICGPFLTTDDWRVKSGRAHPDLRLSGSYANSWGKLALMSAVNFSRGQKARRNMENSLYGPYDTSNDKAVFLHKAVDDQYETDERLGAMLNISLNKETSRYEWNNILNHLAKDRYCERWGVNAQPDSINDMEYSHSSRTTYNTQLRGRHTFAKEEIDWAASYSHANRLVPDRRLIERTDRTDQTMGIYRIGREDTKLDEHIASVAANYLRTLAEEDFAASVKTGLYGECRAREYSAHQFQYGWNPQNALPTGWLFDKDVQKNILIPSNFGDDKLYLYEEVNYMNNYTGRQHTAAGYLAAELRYKRLKAYLGVRYEFCRQTLGLNTRQFEPSLQETQYDYSDYFPSVNFTYELTKRHQFRAAYGRSANRPEFRELSPSVFYDFDLGSSVMGNYGLRAAYIDNLDFRWEFYPNSGEQISIALFHKHFKNPIEWTYTVAGGTDLVYSYTNAKGATNYGVEIDVRKNLAFLGLKDFSLSLNASLIKSQVEFEPGTNNIDRPMQGQSPYMVNAGIFYSNEKQRLDISLLYNIIGKRIIGIGSRYGNAPDGTLRNIPNSYEMPRNQLDLTLGKRFGKWELKAALRDILAQDYLFQQFEDVTINAASKREQPMPTARTIEQTTKRYKPGRNCSLIIGYKF